MPELPEVESVKIQLLKFLIGHKVEGVEVRLPKVIHGDTDVLIGAKIINIRRFAKVLVIDFDKNYSTIIHIKLTGQLIYRGPKLKKTPELSRKVVGGVPGPHTHLILNLDRDGVLFYNDVRRFGWVKVVRTEDVESFDFIAKLGPEPMRDLTLDKFTEIVGSARRTIKSLLMDQSKLSGVGNIYANDALWLAKIHPERKSNSLSQSEQSKLYSAIESVLKRGLRAGGASELSFVTPDGAEGDYQNHFLAYGLDGKLCPRCKKEKFLKTKVSGRGTYHCPICQKLAL